MLSPDELDDLDDAGFPWTGEKREHDLHPKQLNHFDRDGVAIFFVGTPVIRSMWRDLAAGMLSADHHRDIHHLFLVMFVAQCHQQGIHRVTRAIEKIKKPVWCHVEFALGASMHVMAACDQRFAIHDARLGLAPIDSFLDKEYPQLSAADCLRLNGRIDGRTGKELGVVDTLVPNLQLSYQVCSQQG